MQETKETGSDPQKKSCQKSENTDTGCVEY